MLVRNRIVDTVLQDKDLQKTFDWKEETVQYKARDTFVKTSKNEPSFHNEMEHGEIIQSFKYLLT